MGVNGNLFFFKRELISRILLNVIIHLKKFSQTFFSGLPRNVQEKHSFFYLALLQMGFTMPIVLLQLRWALTITFSTLPKWRYIFCCTIPRVSPAGCYPAISSCGVRTFLCNAAITKLSYRIIIYYFIKCNFLETLFVMIFFYMFPWFIYHFYVMIIFFNKF